MLLYWHKLKHIGYLMPTKAANEFSQPGNLEVEDGLNFKAWYHPDAMKRVIWKEFNQLDAPLKKDIVQPYVFFDGIDTLTLEDMLTPLITKLKNSSAKYFPFIFKPELASVHYVAGFLRKNADKTVSIILFNPTGTTPRMDYGNFAYELHLMNSDSDFEIEKNKLYFEVHRKTLQYTVINPKGERITRAFSREDLSNLGIVLDFNKPLTLDIIKEQLRLKAADILKITLARGHTEKKIEIISSSKQLQTHEKDGGPLVSCGPLSLAFIQYVMRNPEYMAKLDKEFHLPKFLDIKKDEVLRYKELVMSLRREHYKVLDTVADKDSELNDGAVDLSYLEVTNLILNSRDREEPKIDKDLDLWPEDIGVDWYEDEDLEHQDDDGEEVAVNPVLIVDPTIKPTIALTIEQAVMPIEMLSVELPKSEQKASIVEPKVVDSVTIKKPTTAPDSKSTEKSSVSKIDPETRKDVLFIQSQINRFRENEKSCFSINNGKKADAIDLALKKALGKGVEDVRTDIHVKDALAIHRIFGFFGLKATKATTDLEESLTNLTLKNKGS